MAYSVDLRERVVASVKGGMTQTLAAQLFLVNRVTLHRWLKRTDLTPKKTGTKAPTKLALASLEQALDENPDATLTELGHVLGVTPQAIFYACKRNKITRKKNHAVPRAR
jgi:transposase